ncbi:MAG: 16S rRNA (guanine(527)-N(7))-methyltransferase RsmG [Elusimicrobiales bacterium]
MDADNQTLDALNALGIVPSPQQLEQLRLYARIVEEKNSRLNLTAARGEAELWRRHVADGLFGALALRGRAKTETPSIADVGAGAGFTGFALKIMFPGAHVHFVESVERKCAFLHWAAARLGLRDVSVHCMRLDCRNAPFQADFVFERAMGPLEEIIKPCLSLAAPGGWFAAYQTHAPSAALPPHETIEYRLAGEQQPRSLLLFSQWIS